MSSCKSFTNSEKKIQGRIDLEEEMNEDLMMKTGMSYAIMEVQDKSPLRQMEEVPLDVIFEHTAKKPFYPKTVKEEKKSSFELPKTKRKF